jgi:hypothetical protein
VIPPDVVGVGIVIIGLSWGIIGLRVCPERSCRIA